MKAKLFGLFNNLLSLLNSSSCFLNNKDNKGCLIEVQNYSSTENKIKLTN